MKAMKAFLRKTKKQDNELIGGKISTQNQGKIYCNRLKDGSISKNNPRCVLAVSDEVGEKIKDNNPILKGEQEANLKYSEESKAFYCSKKGEKGRCFMVVNKFDVDGLKKLREDLKRELKQLIKDGKRQKEWQDSGYAIVDEENEDEEVDEEEEINYKEEEKPKKKQYTKIMTKSGIKKIERSQQGLAVDKALENYLKLNNL